jgi:hypothetical protein
MDAVAYTRNAFTRQANLEESNTHNPDCFFPWVRDGSEAPLILHPLLDPLLTRVIEAEPESYLLVAQTLAESAERAIPNAIDHLSYRHHHAEMQESSQKLAAPHLRRAYHYLDLAHQVLDKKSLPFTPQSATVFEAESSQTVRHAKLVADLAEGASRLQDLRHVARDIKEARIRVRQTMGPEQIAAPATTNIFPSLSRHLVTTIKTHMGLYGINPDQFAREFRAADGAMQRDARVAAPKRLALAGAPTDFRL